MSVFPGPRGFAGITSDGYQERYVIVGSGSPEGVIPADIGAIYKDSAAATFYHKLTGFGTNTGWSAAQTGGAGSFTTLLASGASTLQAVTGTTGAFTGALSGLAPTATKTTAYPVVAADAGKVFSNTAAGSQVIYTLPAATAGLTFTFVNTAAGATYTQVLATTPDKISSNGVQSSAAGTLTATQIWSSVTITCPVAAVWQVTSMNGIWTLSA